MKIEIDCNVLKNELNKIKDIVSARHTMPLLSNAFLEASEDQTLTIKATDLDLWISTSCECNVITPGRVTVQALTLLKIVSSLRDTEISLEVEENHWAKVSANSISCRIPGTHPDDFPTMTTVDDAEYFQVSPALFLNMINKTSFAISDSDSRPTLSGAFFKHTIERKLLMIGTDGLRLAKIESETDEFKPHTDLPNKLRNGLIIPIKGIKLLGKILSPEAYPLEFAVKNNSIAFKHGPMLVTCRLIDGTYPDVNSIIPRTLLGSATIDREAFLRALKFVQNFSNAKTNRVRLKLSNDTFNVYANDPETGEGSQNIDTDFSGEELSAGYNHKFLSDILNVIEGDEIIISMPDITTPTVIKDTSLDSLLYIIMPMRL